MGQVHYGELAKSATKGAEPIAVGGPYNFEVTGAEHSVSKSGNRWHKLEVTVIDGPLKGKKAWPGVTFKKDNPGTFFGQFRALGIGDAFFAQFPVEDGTDPLDAFADDEALHDALAAAAIGKRFSAKVKPDKPYNDQPRTQVDWFKPLATDATAVPPSVPGTAPAATTGSAPDLPPGL